MIIVRLYYDPVRLYNRGSPSYQPKDSQPVMIFSGPRQAGFMNTDSGVQTDWAVQGFSHIYSDF